MDPEEFERAIEHARGYAELGMFIEAWDAIESLPGADRVLPGALAVRLLVCAGLQKWEMGTEIVRRFSPELPLDLREAAGRFHLAHAEALCTVGDVRGAKEAVARLSIVWPEGRMEALHSKALAPIW